MAQPSIRTKKQKILILLPLFMICVAGLIFAAVNIGKKKAPAATTKSQAKSAFNTKLPSPDLPVKEKNKLEIYMEAAKDSARKKAEWEKDPNNKRMYDPGPMATAKPVKVRPRVRSELPGTQVLSSGSADPNVNNVNDRLQKLYAALNQSGTGAKLLKSPAEVAANLPATNPEAERLEKLLQQSRMPDTTTDPNLARVEKVLDKVLEIQHPERAKDRLATDTATTRPSVYAVTTNEKEATEAESGYTDTEGSGPNVFYGLGQEPDNDAQKNTTTIQAEVQETQTVQNGSTIKLRLLQDIFVAGHQIPANNFIYGTCAVNSERLHVQLTSAVCNNEIYPISLKVYDIDGLEGIFVPGAITRDVTKEGLSQGIGGLGITSLDPSLGAQAAAAGIETAKSLLSKKIRAVVVTVKAGHRVLLENPRVGH
jgi:conjugative transposon TraM protein